MSFFGVLLFVKKRSVLSSFFCLTLLKNRYDLRRQLEETRRELAQALYQNDAAVRVIARVTMERDQARGMIGAGASVPVVEDNAMAVEEEAAPTGPAGGLPAAALSDLTNTWTALSGGRKGRAIPSDQVPPTDLANYTETDSKSYHKNSGKTGVKYLSVKGSEVMTIGADKQVIIYEGEGVKGSVSLGKSLAGKKEVTCGDFTPSDSGAGLRIIAVGSDGSVRIVDEGFEVAETNSLSKEARVVGVHFHPNEKCVGERASGFEHLQGRPHGIFELAALGSAWQRLP